MKHKLHIKSKTPPVIELDPEASAVYIRFSNAKVAKSLDVGRAGEIVVIDVDSSGHLVGMEVVGIEPYSVKSLALLVKKHTSETVDLAPAQITVAA